MGLGNNYVWDLDGFDRNHVRDYRSGIIMSPKDEQKKEQAKEQAEKKPRRSQEKEKKMKRPKKIPIFFPPKLLPASPPVLPLLSAPKFRVIKGRVPPAHRRRPETPKFFSLQTISNSSPHIHSTTRTVVLPRLKNHQHVLSTPQNPFAV